MRPIDLQARNALSVSPLEIGLVELPTRPRSIYTMGMRREAIEAADSGLLRQAADLTLAAITESGYCRGILADLVQGLWGLPRTFVGRADMIADLDDSVERVGQWRTMFPEADAIRLTSWGITLGVGVGQMRRKYDARASYDYPISPEEAANGVWKGAGAYRSRPIGAHDTRTLRTWSSKWLRNQWWDNTWWLMTADGEIRISPLDNSPVEPDEMGRPRRQGNPDEWLLYMPYGEIKPWEWGAWKSATLAFVAERDATFDRLRHSEVLAPVRVGKVPQGTTERQRKKYLDQIRAMQRMAAFVLPPGLEYTIVESTGRVADIYAAIIEWAEKQYAMITGSIITATGTAGFSKGDVQERFTRSILASFASTLATCLHRYGLIPWARENYGSDDAPRAEWDTAPPEDKRARAETIGTAGESITKLYEGMQLAGIRPTSATIERFVQTLGFECEPIPVGEAKAAKIDLAPTDKAKAFRVWEVRAGEGYPRLGDDRDDLTLAEMDGVAKGAPPPDPSGATEPTADDALATSDEPPTDESAATLAAKMSDHGITRCEHGSVNKCRKCGIERDRDFDVGPDGEPIWHVKWKPILRVATYTNGAAHRPLLSIGGDA